MSGVDTTEELLEALERLWHAVDDSETLREEHYAAKQGALDLLTSHGRNPMSTESLSRVEERKRRTSSDPEPLVEHMMVKVLKPFYVSVLDPKESLLKKDSLVFYDPVRPAVMVDGVWNGSVALDQAMDNSWISLESEIV